MLRKTRRQRERQEHREAGRSEAGTESTTPFGVVSPFQKALLAMCVVALVLRLAMLSEYWQNNPTAQTPVLDGAVYWNLAEQYATGRLVGDTPYQSAPFYPAVLGLLRALGGGLRVLYLVQIGMHLMTALLLAWIARRRFGEAVGLLGAGVFLLMGEPAIGCFRVLSNTLQLLILVAFWALTIRAQDRPSQWRWAVTGLGLGLLCLTNGSLILIVPPLAVWITLAAQSGPDLPRKRVRHALAMLVGWVVALVPSTTHNFLACGEFIPISAQSGLTLWHGSAPGAAGTYTAAPGVTTDKDKQHLDAIQVYTQATGKEGTWREVDRFFRTKAFDSWYADPGRAVSLAMRKAYWFFTARHYGDIHVPALEAATGIDPRWHLAPLPTALLLPLVIVAAVLWSGRWRTFGPELLLLAIPLFVVMVFWYSPRYRLPIVPVTAVASGWLLHEVWQRVAVIRVRRAVAAALTIGIALQLANRATGFDSIAGVGAAFHNLLARVMVDQDRRAEAVEQYRQTLRYAPNDATALTAVGAALIDSGDYDSAVSHLENAAASDPSDAAIRNWLGTAHARKKDYKSAAASYADAMRLDPAHPDAKFNLAGTLMVRNRPQEAVGLYRQILEHQPDRIAAWLHLGSSLFQAGRKSEAVEAWRKGLEQDSSGDAESLAADRIKARIREVESD